MSRASDLRDAVITELQTAFPTRTVEAFLVPHYSREELEAGSRIAVRTGSRTIEVDQGPDDREVTVEIGVVGLLPSRVDAGGSDYRTAQVAAGDALDTLVESVIALWSPNGALSRSGLAEHRFVGIRQAMNFDPKKLYDEGIFLSMIELTYQDTVDD